MDLNKGISTPIAIGLIIVISVVVGVLVWQLKPVPEAEPEPGPQATTSEGESTLEQPSDYTSQSACQDAGYYWYDGSCHKEKQEEVLGITEFPQPWQDGEWTKPSTLEASKVVWEGVIEKIYPEKDIIKAIRMPSGIPEYTIFVQDDTKITDNNQDKISLQELGQGDVIAVSKGKDQMKDTYTQDWQVLINSDEINFLQECIGEGKKYKNHRSQCCLELSRIGSGSISDSYCTKCGDGVCKGPEGKDNCAVDCTEVGEQISLLVTPDFSTVTREDGVISFMSEEGTSFSTSVEIIADENTEFSRRVSPEEPMDVFSQDEFYSRYLDKESEGLMPTRPFNVEGVLLERNKIKATELWKGVQ